MTPETESRAAASELDTEQEVDFSRYWNAVVERWWLLLAGIVAGLLIGYVVSLGSSKTYEASSIVYLGAPKAPGAGGDLTGVPTQLALAGEVARAEETIKRVAAQVGLRRGQLRDHVSTQAVLGITTGKVGTPAPIVSITVTGKSRRKVEAAAEALASIVLDRSSTYVDVKIGVLEDRVDYVNRRLAVIERRLAIARQEQEEVLANTKLDATDRLIALENFNSLIVASEGRQSSLEQDQFSLRQFLQLARDVEHGRIVTHPVAVGTTARSPRNSMLVGALIGLVLGIVAALVWEPIGTRVRPGQSV